MARLRIWPQAVMGGWDIDGQDMSGPAWQPLNLEQLWLPASNRVNNRVIPDVTGSEPFRPRKAERSVDIQLVIAGDVDQTGSSNSDETEGFTDNIDTITANVVDPPSAPTKTRTSTLTMPDGTTRTAEIQVVGFEYQPIGNNMARGVLTITIPAGEHS